MSDYTLIDGGMLLTKTGKPLGKLRADGVFEYLSEDCQTYRARIARWANAQDPPIEITDYVVAGTSIETEDDTPTQTMTSNVPPIEPPAITSGTIGKDPSSPTGWRGENGQPCPPRPIANLRSGIKDERLQRWMHEHFPNQWKAVVGYMGSREVAEYDEDGEFIGTKTVHYARMKTCLTEKQVVPANVNPEEFSWDA